MVILTYEDFLLFFHTEPGDWWFRVNNRRIRIIFPGRWILFLWRLQPLTSERLHFFSRSFTRFVKWNSLDFWLNKIFFRFVGSWAWRDFWSFLLWFTSKEDFMLDVGAKRLLTFGRARTDTWVWFKVEHVIILFWPPHKVHLVTDIRAKWFEVFSGTRANMRCLGYSLPFPHFLKCHVYRFLPAINFSSLGPRPDPIATILIITSICLSALSTH